MQDSHDVEVILMKMMKMMLYSIMQNMYQPPAKHRRRRIENQEQHSWKMRFWREVVQNKIGTNMDDCNNEDKAEQEQEHLNEESESEDTTTIATKDKCILWKNQRDMTFWLHIYLLFKSSGHVPWRCSGKIIIHWQNIIQGSGWWSITQQEVKIYSSTEEVNHFMGYIFHKSYKMETNLFIAMKEQNFGLPGVITFLPRLVN